MSRGALFPGALSGRSGAVPVGRCGRPPGRVDGGVLACSVVPPGGAVRCPLSLINLLLAVINSSFSETHSEQQKTIEAQKAKLKTKKKVSPDDDMAFDESEPIDEIGIS